MIWLSKDTNMKNKRRSERETDIHVIESQSHRGLATVASVQGERNWKADNWVDQFRSS